jgi:hypothetical protein
MKTSLIPFAIILAVSGSALAGDGDTPQDQPAKFKIATRRKDDALEVRVGKGKTVFAVKSPFGISQAVIERREATWPKAVVLRLHLKGLSSFRTSTGKVGVDAAVSIDEGKAKVRLWQGGKEGAPLDEKSPSGWMSASSAATASRPGSYPSRAGTSRWRCRRRSSRATRSRSRSTGLTSTVGEHLVVGAIMPFLRRLLQWPHSDGITKWPKYQRTSSLTR